MLRKTKAIGENTYQNINQADEPESFTAKNIM